MNWQPYIQPTGQDFEDDPAIVAWCELELHKRFRYSHGAVYQKTLLGWKLLTPAPKFERNEPCPCESGLKFKKCCGK